MNPITTLAVSKVIKEKEEKNACGELLPGEHTVDAVVRITGTIKVGEDESYTPTVDVPLKSTIAFLFKRMGFQRDAAAAMLRDAMTDALNAGEKGAETIAALDADVEAAKEMVTAMLGDLPKKVRKGKVTTKLSVKTID